ncbi:hypothetical protein KQX54_016885 [Cotesia glomerata]|uniref:Adenosine deaminase domain-containing protein n=1 Tax=Cotesia glomerata TaxID=32391 RepID=A0AAV7IXB1_COTGL|nr:hypothetical protein KQX54_016885 [Cotesia glomerata]
MRKEKNHIFGAKLVLTSNEDLVDNLLKKFKKKEIDDAFLSKIKFLPAKNFIEAREDIEKTDVFKIIKKMPKGAALHAHATAIVSDKWIYENIHQRLPRFFREKGYSIVDRLDIIKPLINHVRFFFHAGETGWYGLETDENLLDAVLLNTTRVGHGYALLKHPKVLQLMKTKHIAVEVCPISNQVLGLVEDMRNHPASALFAKDFPVVISNDDPGLWGAKGLIHDFYEAFMGMMSLKAGLKALKQLALNSFYYSSMDDLQKQKTYDVWRLRWDIFINEIIDRYNLSK